MNKKSMSNRKYNQSLTQSQRARRNQKIRKFVNSGSTIEQAAIMFNCSTTTVMRALSGRKQKTYPKKTAPAPKAVSVGKTTVNAKVGKTTANAKVGDVLTRFSILWGAITFSRTRSRK